MIPDRFVGVPNPSEFLFCCRAECDFFISSADQDPISESWRDPEPTFHLNEDSDPTDFDTISILLLIPMKAPPPGAYPGGMHRMHVHPPP
jgi:hypothetical protein